MFLFSLSHLDSDHINGINDLIAATEVSEAVLPYLDDIDRLIAAVRADSEGRYRGNYSNFLQDIPAWFKDRGVKKITFINPRNDDDEDGRMPEYPDGIDGGGSCLLYTSPSPRDATLSRMPSSA